MFVKCINRWIIVLTLNEDASFVVNITKTKFIIDIILIFYLLSFGWFVIKYYIVGFRRCVLSGFNDKLNTMTNINLSKNDAFYINKSNLLDE